MNSINGESALYGIIGDPVKHSLSPIFQNYFLQQANINATYLPFLVHPEKLKESLEGLHASHILGLNVTVPHKESAMKFVQADADSSTIGAVNTLRRNSKGWEATNTDWQGFASVLTGLQADVSTSSVLVFGAGGTTRAVCHALHQRGAKNVWICNRTLERAAALALELENSYIGTTFRTIEWNENSVKEKLHFCQVVINTSSVGLNASDVFPFALSGEGVAIDAVYKPSGQTAFSEAAKQGGFTAVDGLPMLIAQGIASFHFWGHTRPDELESLRWIESQLKREPLSMPGWSNQ